MNDKDVREKYGIGKKFGIGIMLQMLFMIVALALTIYGIVMNTDIHRGIIYVGQALVCIVIIVSGLFRFRVADRNLLKAAINAYALLEAMRAALLNTSGVDPWIGAISRFILAILACNCVLLAERMESKYSEWISIAMVALEIILYVVFLIGFPGVMQGHMNRFLPLVGILIAGSIAILHKGKNIQLGVEEDDE